MTAKHTELEKALGYRFKDKSHLERALTHRSYRYEEDSVNDDNQRLEFLGDAALGFIAGAHVFHSYPDLEEGELTRLRSRITSSRGLSQIAKSIRLGDYLRLGRGETQTGGQQRASNLTDGLEAILGAAYLDGGVRAVEKIFDHLFLHALEASAQDKWADNPKGELQELCQKKWKNSPRYRVHSQKGPAHSREFTVVVVVNGREMGQGEGSNKRSAEMEAARRALETIDLRRAERKKK